MTQFTTGALQRVIVTSNGNLGGIVTKRMTDKQYRSCRIVGDGRPAKPAADDERLQEHLVDRCDHDPKIRISVIQQQLRRAAYTINSANLGSVSMTNNSSPRNRVRQSPPQGELCNALRPARRQQTVHVNQPGDKRRLRQRAGRQGITPADFEVRVVKKKRERSLSDRHRRQGGADFRFLFGRQPAGFRSQAVRR